MSQHMSHWTDSLYDSLRQVIDNGYESYIVIGSSCESRIVISIVLLSIKE